MTSDALTYADIQGPWCTRGCGHMKSLHHDRRCDGLGEDNERCDCSVFRDESDAPEWTI